MAFFRAIPDARNQRNIARIGRCPHRLISDSTLEPAPPTGRFLISGVLSAFDSAGQLSAGAERRANARTIDSRLARESGPPGCPLFPLVSRPSRPRSDRVEALSYARGWVGQEVTRCGSFQLMRCRRPCSSRRARRVPSWRSPGRAGRPLLRRGPVARSPRVQLVRHRQGVEPYRRRR